MDDSERSIYKAGSAYALGTTSDRNTPFPKDTKGLEAGDRQEGGNHYQTAIEPIEYILANEMGYCEGNVIKYVSRHKRKNGKEDILKAIHYLEFILDDQYGEEL